MAAQSISQISFFSDEKANRFNPLTLTRPLDDLRAGIYTIREKWEKTLSLGESCRLLPDYMMGVFEKGVYQDNKPCLWLNSRYLPNAELVVAISDLKINEKLVDKKEVIAALIDEETSAQLFHQGDFQSDGLKKIEFKNVRSLKYIWDLIELNSDQIKADIGLTNLRSISKTGLGVEAVVHYKENIFIGDDVHIEPGCIFIAKDGPIVIEDGAEIEAGSILRGPIAIGKGATVKMGARIYGGTTIGPVCKVGGEVSGSIFHSYSNKAHDGFCGNSIFGQWVNLGANTITSNLKNDYKSVKVIDWKTKKSIETKRQFLGTIMGDHSKTAINTMLNTGTMCGVSSNVFIDYLSPKLIESFTWLGPNGGELYRFEKAIEVMKSMMKRRDISMSDNYLKMMNAIFELREQNT
ncbi:MAG TPA: putative sugar nucleotidyl transferase [Gracilimonas sp.]|uniref:putative sugar nucleotidyl transferase n=1 Tax=Gracilimonas sp. TaxID=1974203 RepID=UPI002DABD528|nr:putative sugar nucleotidyl transferase [Gracilimonas sp.]